MLGADERGVRRTCGFAAATSEEGNNADGKNHKPARAQVPPKSGQGFSKMGARKRAPSTISSAVEPGGRRGAWQIERDTREKMGGKSVNGMSFRLKNPPIFFLLLLMFAAWPLGGANAQILSPLSDGQTAVYLNYHQDPVLAYSVGFATGDGEVMHVTDLQVPVHPEEQDWQLKLGGQTNLLEGIADGWDISPAVSVLIRHREGEGFKGSNIGLDFTGLFGYYGAWWFAIGEFGYNNFTKYFSGIRLGASVAQLEINLRLGKHHRTSGNDNSESSFLTAGVNFRF
ncbi:MAG: hypothetical protein IIA14_05740 [SAR324 cluster bacterium]|nr:hypothetical protein [SAR324 cluster bacterium]